MTHADKLRWVGDQLDTDASNKGIGQGSEGARYCWAAATEIERLQAELETERMRVIACGVVALANTPESAAKARDMLPEYRSAPCDNVVQAVDREMALRGRVEQLEFKLDQEQKKSGQEMIERLSLVEKIQALEVENSTLCGHIEQLREAVKEGLRTYKVPMTARICEAIAASTDGLKGY